MLAQVLYYIYNRSHCGLATFSSIAHNLPLSIADIFTQVLVLEIASKWGISPLPTQEIRVSHNTAAVVFR